MRKVLAVCVLVGAVCSAGAMDPVVVAAAEAALGVRVSSPKQIVEKEVQTPPHH